MFAVDHVDAIRVIEIERIMSFFPPGGRIVEIGAATGKQVFELQRRGAPSSQNEKGRHQSGRSPLWLKSKNPDSAAV